ncbi:hypothetical protein QTP88_018774 [Uroleucon formosanum]
MQKKEDKINALASNNIRVLVFDLEQVLDTPALSTNVSFYKRLLSTFNLTIRDCFENEGTECYMWHEAIGERGSNEIASCLYQKILNLLNNVTHIITYSDTCGGQNRNINMAAMLSLVTANSSTLHIIDQKFLLPGHTHLECDVDHTKIERAKKLSDIPIMIPRDWYQFVRTVKGKKPFKVTEMKQEQFFSFSNLVSTSLTKKTVDTDGNKVNWFHIRWIRYEKVYGFSGYFFGLVDLLGLEEESNIVLWMLFVSLRAATSMSCAFLMRPSITMFLLREEKKSFKMIPSIGFEGGKYAATMVVFVLLMFNWMFALCIDWLAVGGLILYLILLRIKIAAPP